MISKALPEIKHFTPVEPSKLDIDFVRLRQIDLSKYDQGRKAQEELAEEIRIAMTTQGFFTLVNHGISESEIERQVDIGHTILECTSDEEKTQHLAPMVDEGSYHGFKMRGHWKVADEVRDRIENFNVYRDMSLRPQPRLAELYKPEITSFIDFVHQDILYKLLRLFAIALKLDDEELLVKWHSYQGHDESWLRYMQYYDEFTEEEKKATGGVWGIGHQDFTSLSLLFSQPMSALQVRDYDDSSEWKYVEHVPGAIVVNAGQIMMWWTGDYFNAAIHRVFQPPEDQRNHTRSGVFYFVVPNDEVVINTLLDHSPVLRDAGVQMAHEADAAPTSKEWSNGKVRTVGRNSVFAGAKSGENNAAEKIGKVTTTYFR